MDWNRSPNGEGKGEGEFWIVDLRFLIGEFDHQNPVEMQKKCISTIFFDNI